MADEAMRQFERDVLSGKKSEEESKQFWLARGCCPFCGSREIEEWDKVECSFSTGGIPIAGLEKVVVPGFVCLDCAGPSRLAMHWATLEIDGTVLFTKLDVISMMKPGRHGVEPKLGKK